jgi:GTP cyclohydrolase I
MARCTFTRIVPEASEQVQKIIENTSKERVKMSEHDARAPHPTGAQDWEAAIPQMEDDDLPDLRVAADKDVAHKEIADAVRTILLNVGEDPDRPGLLKTPERVARAFDELLEGYTLDPEAVINDAFFETDYSDMVVVKDIEFYSMCEHHILPFFGKVHVAYIPDGRVLGLSKIPRIVEMFARRLQLQERMTQQIADFINEVLQPRGVAVIVTGQHMCSMMRGVNKPDSKMVTQVLTGEFDNSDIRRQLNERIEAAS